MKTSHTLAILMLTAGLGPVIGQTEHSGHSDGMNHGTHRVEHGSPVELTEPGQGAFAALSEVVRLLEEDPDTDWSRVDLDGLRNHLVDMDRVVMDSIVSETALPDGLLMRVTGDAKTVASLMRMVPAHAAQLAQDPRWSVEAEVLDDAVSLTVKSTNPVVIARIRGLGFFGLMASQDHHRAHHLMMARGEDAHSHQTRQNIE
ncbi:hypothetical protein [Palleronia caenipelagi]|uniref:Uncharacterized protein n=1 Tax=Palleronia caenipelagi TaxID=2489174 RepID=A0A547PKX8_9RHOB|nr:hypothetical protein [Palleronia caenipelagi]TRD14802.1 hypothetical protein FEV53_18295 [Palleronia caenipelagi]